MRAVLKNARITPKKANLVAGMIVGKKAIDALTFLKLTPKKAAHVIYKVLLSAVANAVNNFDQKKENLVVKKAHVNAGFTLKRGLPIARGQWHPLLKRNSHITVEVGVVGTGK